MKTSMKYIDYVDRGFERNDMNDNVLYRETGYTGYFLRKELTENATIEVYDSELDMPKLYIKEKTGDFIILPLTGEMVMNWFTKGDSK